MQRGGELGGEKSRAKEKLQLRAAESRLFWCQRPSKMKANEKNEDHGIWSYHFMANRWENNGNSDRLFILGGSKITADGDCSHEIQRHLLLGRKAMTNLDSILKSRDITLQTKVCLVKAMGFPVVMYGCESWSIKKLNAKEFMLLNCGVGEDF